MFGPLKCLCDAQMKVWRRERFTYDYGVLGVTPDSDGTQKTEPTTNAGRSSGAGCHRRLVLANQVFQTLKTGSVV